MQSGKASSVQAVQSTRVYTRQKHPRQVVMSLLRLASRLPRAAARPHLRCLSGSHSDFETVRKKVPATAEGVQAMIKEQARRGVPRNRTRRDAIDAAPRGASTA